MFNRIGIATVWFAAFLSLHEVAWSMLGSPRIFGLLIGLIAAAFFYFDPAHLFRAPTVQRINVRHDQRLASSEGAPATH